MTSVDGGVLDDNLHQILGESCASESDRETFSGDGNLRGWFEKDGVTCDQSWDGVGKLDGSK
jgi:hypothetical protein